MSNADELFEKMNGFDDYFNKFYKEKIEYIIPSYIKIIKNCFDLNKWGFQMIYAGHIPDSHPSIVYESSKCRVRFIWEESTDERVREETTQILYGRLHAPISRQVMDWNGEKCYCWHNGHKVLSFLDGLTPQQARKNGKSPIFMWDFYQANKNKGWRQAEFEARRQAAVWEYYGQKLFDVFDLNRPDLWQQYTNFLKEYYNTEKKYVDPFPLYKVC